MARFIIPSILLLSLWMISPSPAMGMDSPVISMGPVATGGMSDITGHSESGGWKRGYNCGAGAAIEAMFTPRWGLFTALIASRNSNTMTSVNPLLPTEMMDTTWTSWRLTIPLCGVASFNPGDFSFQFLGGLHLSHILTSSLSPDPDGVATVDVLKYLNYYAVGVTGGITILYRAGHYTDCMLGVTGSYDLSTLNNTDRGDSQSRLNLWEIKLITGVMFRTKLFP